MRLLVGCLILVVAALDLRFGRAGSLALPITGLLCAVLLILSVGFDHLVPVSGERRERDRQLREKLHSEAG
jgi:hypothetical protein